MRTFRFTLTRSLAGAFLAGATWTAFGLETAPQVAMAPATSRSSAVTSSLIQPARMAAGASTWGRVSVANVNVRWGPGSQHGVITVLHGGDYVRVQSSADGWLRIEWPQAAPAWVASDLVQPDGRVSGSHVRVRAAGLTSAPVLVELNKTDRVEILDTVGNWYKIKPPANISAYVSAKCVVLGVTAPPESADVQNAVSEKPAKVQPAPRSLDAAKPEVAKPAQASVKPAESEQAQPVSEPASLSGPVAHISAETPKPPSTNKPSSQDAGGAGRNTQPARSAPVEASPVETVTPDAAPVSLSVEPVKVLPPVKLAPPVAPVVVTLPAEPAKPSRVNHAPIISVVQVGPVEQPQPVSREPAPQNALPQPSIMPIPPSGSTPIMDDDLEDEDPALKVHTPDQAEWKASKAHEALLALVDEIPTAALLKPSPDQPQFVVVPVDVRAAADQDEFGALLPPPRFVRDRVEAQEVRGTPASPSGLTTSASSLRASAPLVFRLPGQTDARDEFVFLNGKLLLAENGPQGARHKLIAGDKTFFVRADATMVNLDTYKDRQVEVLARWSSGDPGLVVSALHPLE